MRTVHRPPYSGPGTPGSTPTVAEWTEAAWLLQAWIRTCYDLMGVCSLCGSPEPAEHVNGCPWPDVRALLDRSPGMLSL